MVQSAALGFPRIGAKREGELPLPPIFPPHLPRSELTFPTSSPAVKKATEAYWAGKISVEELQKVAKEQRLARWSTLKEQGVDVIPSYVFHSPALAHLVFSLARGLHLAGQLASYQSMQERKHGEARGARSRYHPTFF